MSFEMHKVDHSNGNTLGLKHSAQIPQDFPFGVKHNIGADALHQIGFHIKPGFACAGPANDHDVQVVTMLVGVHPHSYILGEQIIAA